MEKNKSLNTSVGNNDLVDLRDILNKYLQRWYWFVLAVIIAFLIAFFYIKKSDTKYQVKTSILLRSDNSASVSKMDMLENLGLNGLSKDVDDEIYVISSKRIIKQAIDTLGLQVEYYEKEGLKYVDKYKDTSFTLNVSKGFLDSLKNNIVFTVKPNGSTYKVNFKMDDLYDETYKLNSLQESFDTPIGKFSFTQHSKLSPTSKYKIVVYSGRNIVDEYGASIGVSTVNKQSSVIQISITKSNIKKAEDFLNTVVDLYNLDVILDKNIVAEI